MKRSPIHHTLFGCQYSTIFYTFTVTGESVLFFGCRNKTGDDFFRQEWNEIEKDKETPVRIFTCYSRDQVCKTKNDYLFNYE